MKILYTLQVKTWRDTTYGNTYAAWKITNNNTGKTIHTSKFKYGCEQHAEDCAKDWINDNTRTKLSYFQERGIILHKQVTKREAKNFVN